MADRDRARGGEPEGGALHRDRAARPDRLDQLAAERGPAHHSGRPDGGEQALRAAEVRRADDLRDRSEGGRVGERARDADGERHGQHEPLRGRARDRPERHGERAERLHRVRRDDHAAPAAAVARHAREQAEEHVGHEAEDGDQPGGGGVAAGVEHEPGQRDQPDARSDRVEQLGGEQAAPVGALKQALGRAHAASTRRTRGWP